MFPKPRSRATTFRLAARNDPGGAIMPMEYDTLLTDLADGVMTVTLNRPDKLNAFNTVMSKELIDFFQRVNAMDEVRAIVVTGAGRAFCAGADISGGSSAFQVWNDGSKPQKREASD